MLNPVLRILLVALLANVMVCDGFGCVLVWGLALGSSGLNLLNLRIGISSLVLMGLGLSFRGLGFRIQDLRSVSKVHVFGVWSVGVWKNTGALWRVAAFGLDSMTKPSSSKLNYLNKGNYRWGAQGI